MNLENNFIKAEIINFSYSQPKIDEIGYDNIIAQICIPRTYFISAHAPSKINIKFKNSGKIYINCNLNRNTGIVNNTIIYTIKCGEVELLHNGVSLEYYKIEVLKDTTYTFEIKTQNMYGCHTIWSFFHPDEKLEENELNALSFANKQELDCKSEYSLFIQTCNPKKKMAFRCVTSFLNNITKLPKEIIICSLDNINDGSISFPTNINFLCGKEQIFNKLYSKGITSACINHIFNGFKNGGNPNMWLKYIIPRLIIDNKKVLVLDDDVAILGKCEKLLESDKYLTFMDDSHPFYGERTINFYNNYYKTEKYNKIKPYVCAGVYMLNKEKKDYDIKFINDLILKSEHDTDEQSAVGMEIIDSNDYLILTHPEYHHGGWENQNINIDKLNLIHMQGRAVKYRTDKEFINIVMNKRK